VLIDLPKDVQQAQIVPTTTRRWTCPATTSKIAVARPEQIAQVAAAIKRSKRPVIYSGGGVIMSGASPNCASWSAKPSIPVTMTLMGLGAFPNDDPLSLDMLGMHGSVYANYAVDQADLLLAFGVRFDDRVTGKVSEFAKHGKIVHIDIDPSEINKNKEAHIPIVSDIKYALAELNKSGRSARGPGEWHRQIAAWKKSRSRSTTKRRPASLSQSAIQELWNG
jgi:acetolactate synthase-1/2/3 large subunit